MNFADEKLAETAPANEPETKKEPAPTAEKTDTASKEPEKKEQEPPQKRPYFTAETKEELTAYIKEQVKNKELKLEELQFTAKELEEKAKKVPELESEVKKLVDERKFDKWVASGLNPKQFEKYKSEIVLAKGSDNIAELRKAYDLDPVTPGAIASTETKTKPTAPTYQPVLNPYTRRRNKI